MMLRSKLTYIIAAIVAVAVLATGGVYYWNSSNSYVAKVAGEKISKGEFNFFLSQVKYEMETNAALADENAKKAFWESKIDGKDAKVVAKENALKSAKEFKINLIKAKESKIELTKDETKQIDTAIDSMVTEQGGRVKAEEAIKSEYNMNLTEYKAFYKDYTLISKFRAEDYKKVQVNDADLKKFYSEQMETADYTTVRHILILTKDANGVELSADKLAEAKKKADDILAKVKAGSDFGTLAKESSEDTGTKDTKGQLTFGKGEMVKEFEEWAFKAKVGDIGMVKTDYGFHIMKKPSFEEMTKDNYEVLKSGAQQFKFSKDLENLKNDPKYDAVINQRVLDSIVV
ncbi:MAG: hypothetical protein K0R31_1180 [Clostridiales bacterium]|jgi:foldase protein PrsA|nr:hypothetical protein [Clostridiales bacterium]